MTHILINGKFLMLMLVVLSFAASILSHNLAASLYAKTVEKSLDHSDSSSYPPITPTSSGLSDNVDNQPQHHDTANDQHHEHGSNDGGSSSNSSSDHHSISSNNNNNNNHHQHNERHQHHSDGSSDSSDSSDGTDDDNTSIIEVTQQ